MTYIDIANITGSEKKFGNSGVLVIRAGNGEYLTQVKSRQKLSKVVPGIPRMWYQHAPFVTGDFGGKGMSGSNSFLNSKENQVIDHCYSDSNSEPYFYDPPCTFPYRFSWIARKSNQQMIKWQALMNKAMQYADWEIEDYVNAVAGNDFGKSPNYEEEYDTWHAAKSFEEMMSFARMDYMYNNPNGIAFGIAPEWPITKNTPLQIRINFESPKEYKSMTNRLGGLVFRDKKEPTPRAVAFGYES